MAPFISRFPDHSYRHVEVDFEKLRNMIVMAIVFQSVMPQYVQHQRNISQLFATLSFASFPSREYQWTRTPSPEQQRTNRMFFIYNYPQNATPRQQPQHYDQAQHTPPHEAPHTHAQQSETKIPRRINLPENYPNKVSPKVLAFLKENLGPNANEPVLENPYSILGLTEGATKTAVRKSYFSLSRKTHPDKSHHPMANETFDLINEAYNACNNDIDAN